MTVALFVKVYDGIVVATDSATTIPLVQNGAVVGHQVYNNANKVFQLHRQKPIAAATWGMGVIGAASIETLAKDLRRRLSGLDGDQPGWRLDDDYSVFGVAERIVEMMFDELYSQLAPRNVPNRDRTLGFLVAGYSGHARHSEAYTVVMEDPNVRPAPQLAAAAHGTGWAAYAQTEAVHRMFNGWDPTLPAASVPYIGSNQGAGFMNLLNEMRRMAVVPGMPFADAIEFARFLVTTTIGYSRFTLGPDSVGGQVEIAGISRHEGFKWVSRKHYYHAELNPEDPHHDR